MTDNHPITPPPELVQQWMSEYYGTVVAPGEATADIATRAAQWGADQELEACCEWVRSNGHHGSLPDKLRSIRRPKPPSLKEQMLALFDSYAASFETSGGNSDLVRRALEQLL